MEGVEEVIPIKITVNNCGASLDVVAFRGVPPQRLERFNPDIEVVAGDLQQWMNRSDGALIGSHFAARRKLNVGDTFAAAGVQVQISGIISSPHAQDNNVAYVHLPFLQQVSRTGLGVVTQFNVRVTDPARLDEVAQRIDAHFRSDSDPTVTRPEKAFFARTAQDMIEMVQFSRWLGIGAVAGVLGLVANALLLAARGRVKESAVLQTIGFSRRVIGGLMLLEGLILGCIGGVAGTAAAAIFLAWQRFTLGNEGLTIALAPSVGVTLAGIVVACAVALLASLWPALVAARGPVAEALGRG
jgi:putative ABC transport system permease protein